MDMELRAKELLSAIQYVNVATSSALNIPWNTPVYFAVDQELNFYWTSWKDAQHSLNIKENQKIFITIYDTTRTRGDNNRRCLYLEGVATEVDQQEEIEKAISLLYPQEINEYSSADFTGSALRRIYKAVALKGWLNDISEKQVTKDTVKMRVEIDLLRLSELYKD